MGDVRFGVRLGIGVRAFEAVLRDGVPGSRIRRRRGMKLHRGWRGPRGRLGGNLGDPIHCPLLRFGASRTLVEATLGRRLPSVPVLSAPFP